MKMYHDPHDPQCDAVERYAKSPSLQCACDRLQGKHQCCCEEKRTYHIYILRSQVLSDVEFQLNIITRSRRNEKGISDNNFENTEAIMPMLNRWFDKYYLLALRKLAAVRADDVPDAATDFIRDREDNDIAIAMGDWWNEKALPGLTAAVHEYIVNGIMYEYLLLYVTASDPVTQSKNEQLLIAEEQIKVALTSYHAGKIRKGMHPFP